MNLFKITYSAEDDEEIYCVFYIFAKNINTALDRYKEFFKFEVFPKEMELSYEDASNCIEKRKINQDISAIIKAIYVEHDFCKIYWIDKIFDQYVDDEDKTESIKEYCEIEFL